MVLDEEPQSENLAIQLYLGDQLASKTAYTDFC